MRIAILHNTVAEGGPADEADVLCQLRSVSEALRTLGHEAVVVACGLDLNALRQRLMRMRPDLVFNLVESLNGSGRLIHVVPFLLDSLDISYTGSAAETIYATSSKIIAKERMDQAGSPWGIFSPGWIGPYSLLRSGRIPFHLSERLAHPYWIVKSVWEHASLGLDGDAVIQPDRIQDLIAALKDRAPKLGGDCFAERYVEGREFNLSLLEGGKGPETLPPAEIVFDGYAADQPRIVDYRAKWVTDSFEYAHTVRRFDFSDADAVLLEQLRTIARHCWDLFHLRGYARVDFRVDEQGNPWVLEVNANPCLSPDAGFAAALQKAGIAYVKAIERIVDAACEPDRGEIPAAEGKRRAESSDTDFFWNPDTLYPAFRYEATPEDIPDVRELLSVTGFFYPDEIDTAIELIEERLVKGPESGYSFVFHEDAGGLVGYTCYGPIPCTQSAYDVYWIAVRPDCQGRGRGRILMEETERLIAEAGGSQIYVDTSGRPQYAATRRFYESRGYQTVSVLTDFYSPGDDKVIYRFFPKQINP